MIYHLKMIPGDPMVCVSFVALILFDRFVWFWNTSSYVYCLPVYERTLKIRFYPDILH